MIKFKNNPKINIATAPNRHGNFRSIGVDENGKNIYESYWINRETTWETFVNFLSNTKRTAETQEQYFKMPKSDQDNIKDVGGFTASILKDGKRQNGYIESKNMITLDIDDCTPKAIEDIKEIYKDLTYCVYSTHKHKPNAPRIRLLFPLDKSVSPEEYEAIARKVAAKLDIDIFDPTTFQPARFMYFPSTSYDAEYLFFYNDAEIVNTEKVKAEYLDWTNIDEWPRSFKDLGQVDNVKKHEKKEGNQQDKLGLVGVFNKAYSITEAIETFLSDVYEPTKNQNRYTLINGSTTGGLVIYDNDNLCYSNHSTDKAANKLCNAFDLVRIHLFSDNDSTVTFDTPINKYPSYQKMIEFVNNDKNCKFIIAKDIKQKEEDRKKQEEIAKEEKDWRLLLDVDKNKKVYATHHNIYTIIKNDEELKGIGKYNEFKDFLDKTEILPWSSPKVKGNTWTEYDENQLVIFMSRKYDLEAKTKIIDCARAVMSERSYHPIKEKLESIKPWDGVKRLETIICEVLGAEDNEITRTLTRKTFIAAVARIYEPGCKFDNMLTLYGDQGIGKSTFIQKMAMNPKWFNSSLTEIGTKEAYETIQSSWIIEIPELAPLKKVSHLVFKNFIAQQSDNYRKSYGRQKSEYPRQCIFIGSTNEQRFLVDDTGNRRYWILTCRKGRIKKRVWDLKMEDIEKLWAEAIYYYNQGENIMELPDGMEEQIKIEQEDFMIENDYQDMVDTWIRIKIPHDFERLELRDRIAYYGCKTEDDRISYLVNMLHYSKPNIQLVRRQSFTVIEFIKEFYGVYKNLPNQDKKQIKSALKWNHEKDGFIWDEDARPRVELDNIVHRVKGVLFYNGQ